MSPLKPLVEALGREINRLWASQNPPGTPPLVPLPTPDNGVSHSSGDGTAGFHDEGEKSAGSDYDPG